MGEGTGGTGDWWTRYQDAGEDKQESMRHALSAVDPTAI